VYRVTDIKIMSFKYPSAFESLDQRKDEPDKEFVMRLQGMVVDATMSNKGYASCFEGQKNEIENLKNRIQFLNKIAARLDEGRNYLMSVRSNAITVEDALVSLGYNKNGLEA